MLEQGPGERKILEQASRLGMPIPRKIQEAPELLLGLQLFYMAFIDLSSSRLSGMEEGLIPWGAVQDYADRLELDEEQTEDLHYHISQLDQARQTYMTRKAGRSSGKSKGIRSPHAGTR